MIEYWTKIWSTNKDLFSEAVRSCRENKIDGIEIYIVPGSVKTEDLNIFKKVKTSVHAPHFLHDFNVFELNSEKVLLFKEQVMGMADFLATSEIVVHAGCGKDPQLFRKGIEQIMDPRLLIENKPAIALNGSECFGFDLTQLEFIERECGLNICLDIGHAIKSAEYQGIDYKEFLTEIISRFSPWYFHICGTDKGNVKDKHLNLWEDEFDLRWIKKVLTSVAELRKVKVVFEVPKSFGLENDIKNINFFKSL